MSRPSTISFGSSEARENERGFEPLPEGSYDAVIDKIEARPTKADPNVYYLNVTMSHDDPDSNRKFFGRLPLTNPKAQWVLKRLFNELGAEWFYPENSSEQVDLDFDDVIDSCERALVGAEVVVDLEIREYNGKESNDVKRISGRG